MAPPPEPHGRAVSGSERLYRALLAAYPKEFRRAHGREMAQVFTVRRGWVEYHGR